MSLVSRLKIMTVTQNNSVVDSLIVGLLCLTVQREGHFILKERLVKISVQLRISIYLSI